MDLSEEIFEQFKKDLSKAKSYKDLMGDNGAIKKIMKASLVFTVNNQREFEK